MIELIYNQENKKEENAAAGFLKLPKNIRQIGTAKDDKKIYVEDYVVTYIKQLNRKNDETPRAVVLLGRKCSADGVRYIFVDSALEAEHVEITADEIQFTEESWTSIYERIKQFFDDQEIVGWCLLTPGYPVGIRENIRKAHVNNFAGNDKVLFIVEPQEQEEAFYIYENGQLAEQPGYYIFYEKNVPMQEYMIYQKEGAGTEPKEVAEDNAAKSFRTIIQEKQEINHQKKMMAYMYAASTFLVLVVLVIGITMINNYDKMESMQLALEAISQSVIEEEDGQAYQSPSKTEDQVPVQSVDAGIESQDGQQDETDGEAGGEAVQPEENEPVQTEEPAAEEPAEETAGLPQYYTVKKGDTLVSISVQLYGTSAKVQEICAVNNIDDGDVIYVGQSILLP